MYALTLEKDRKALMDFSCLFCSDSKYILYIDSALTIYLSCNVKKKSKTIVKHYWICFRQASFQSFQICPFSYPHYSWLFLALLVTWIRYQEILICIVDIKSNGIFIHSNWLWNKTDILLKVASNTITLTLSNKLYLFFDHKSGALYPCAGHFM